MKKNIINPEYIRRVNLSLEFIANNLNESISLNDIAQASHFSSYHFHRIFHAIVGETVNDYVMRKKLERAANKLVCNAKLNITDVALSGGFSSSANFSKAFKLYFGVSPSQLRKPNAIKNSKIGKIYSKYGKEFDPKDLYSQFVTQTAVFEPDKLEEMLMNVKIEEKQEKQVAYLTAPNGYELDAIFNTWDKIIAWAEEKGIEQQVNKRYSLCHDNPMITPTEQCRYDALIEIGKNTHVNSPYQKSTIPAGKYGVAYYKGDSEKVSNFYMELYSAWLPNSDYEPDDYPPVAHYLNDSRVDGFVEMEIHIKLKELKKI